MLEVVRLRLPAGSGRSASARQGGALRFRGTSFEAKEKSARKHRAEGRRRKADDGERKAEDIITKNRKDENTKKN